MRLDFISSLSVCRHVGICWNRSVDMLEYMPQTGAHGSSQNMARYVAIVLISPCLRTAWQYRLRWRCTPFATGRFHLFSCLVPLIGMPWNAWIWACHGAYMVPLSLLFAFTWNNCHDTWFMMIRSRCPAGDICQVELDGFVVGWSKQRSNMLKTWLLRLLAFELISTSIYIYMVWARGNFRTSTTVVFFCFC